MTEDAHTCNPYPELALGMMLANAPAVFIGDKMAGRLPLKAIHAVAALIFAGLGIWALLG